MRGGGGAEEGKGESDERGLGVGVWSGEGRKGRDEKEARKERGWRGGGKNRGDSRRVVGDERV